MPRLSYRKALNRALADELARDESVFLLGEDIRVGSAAVTTGLLKRFGPERVLDTPSMRASDDPWLFNRHSVAWYWQHYLADPSDGQDPLASPLLADDLSGLPPALVITAEYDPLCDEGEQYAHRLREAGVPTELARYDGMVHGFFAMSGVFDAGRRAVAQAAGFLADQLGGNDG